MIDIFVINLDRRRDRWLRVSNSLRVLGLQPFNRISAVDGMVLSDDESGDAQTPLSQTQKACWQSHTLAYSEFAKSQTGHDWAMILEDDADFARGFNAELISSAIRWATASEIDLVQLGFNSEVYPKFGGRNLLDLVLAIRSKSRFKFEGKVFVRNQFRSGTHCYLINQRAAKLLQFANLPAFLPADDFLGELARSHSSLLGSQSIRLARLSRSHAGQTDRSTNSDIHSDLA